MIRVKSDPQNKRVFFGIDNLSKRHKKAIRNASFEVGKIIQREGRNAILRGKKTGKTYKVGLRVHRASAPGESPANITGKLQRSIDYDVRGHRQMEYGYKALHGKFMEDGTRFIERRPNLRPLADNKAQTFINSMVRNYRADK